ncbi:hypothetical protein J2T13_004958 [Paenibacillus sp. DS2015]|uniref:hypothetical protein n=1 Tax=Paenibacillus sp. DS2015 TaxID=3373917 RepID=UPI003D236EC5
MGTLEPDLFRLDGSFYLTPDDVNSTDNLGWWSQTMSASDRSFVTEPTLTVLFDDMHSSLGISLFFGTEEYSSDFEVTWYRSSAVMSQILVVANNSQEVSINKPVENYNKITIRFLKTKRPYRYVRLMSMVFGLEEIFDNDSIISARVVEEVDPSASVLSINTLSFTVLNQNQRFNMLNPGGIYAYLQKRQKIKARSGLLLEDGSYEFVSMGAYYLSDWKNSTGLTASLEATDVIGLLDKTTYSASPFWVNEPIINVLKHILTDAGKFKLSILPSVASEVVNGYIPVKSHREALMDVLMSARCVSKMDRNETIVVGRIDYSQGVEEISFDTMLGNPTIEQKTLITAVQANDYTYALGATATEINKSTMVLVGTQETVIDFGGAAKNVSVVVTGAGVIVGSPKISAVSAKVVITGSGSLTITVTGNVYTEFTRSVTLSAGVLSAGEIPQVATLGDNKLMVGKAELVAQNLLDYYQKRIKQSFDYWDNPSIQAGDVVDVETIFSKFSSGVVERQEITFAPNLQGRIEVTG